MYVLKNDSFLEAYSCLNKRFDHFYAHFQKSTSVHLELITVIAMRHVLIRMDHLLALVTLDILEQESLVLVSRRMILPSLVVFSFGDFLGYFWCAQH